MPSKLFQIEWEGETMIVVPVISLSELEAERVEQEAPVLADLVDQHNASNVVIDFCKTDYFGSDALYLLIRVWRRVRARDGQMVLCNLSEHEIDILRTTKLNEIWPIADTREQALAKIAPPPTTGDDQHT
jgi:anti-anti-sigma factor